MLNVSASVDKLLELIHGKIEIFPPVIRLNHGSLEMEIPKGALHWPSIEVFPDKDWDSLVFRIEAIGTRIEAAFPLRASSDLSTVEVVETLWDPENNQSAYKIVNSSLCLDDAKQLVSCLMTVFYPWSINIRTTE